MTALTKDQANGLEHLKTLLGSEGLIKKRISAGEEFNETYPIFEGISEHDFLRAVAGFYGLVGVEFKIGDWVTSEISDMTFQIRNKQDVDVVTEYTSYRLATSWEINRAKEKTWWYSHGRNVWELKEGDILSCEESREYTVERVDEYDQFVDLNCGESIDAHSYESLRKYFRVVIFAEQRLDK